MLSCQGHLNYRVIVKPLNHSEIWRGRRGYDANYKRCNMVHWCIWLSCLVRNNKSRKLANLTQTMSNAFLLVNIAKVSQYLRSHVIQDQNLRLVRFFATQIKIHCKSFFWILINFNKFQASSYLHVKRQALTSEMERAKGILSFW